MIGKPSEKHRSLLSFNIVSVKVACRKQFQHTRLWSC